MHIYGCLTGQWTHCIVTGSIQLKVTERKFSYLKHLMQCRPQGSHPISPWWLGSDVIYPVMLCAVGVHETNPVTASTVVRVLRRSLRLCVWCMFFNKFSLFWLPHWNKTAWRSSDFTGLSLRHLWKICYYQRKGRVRMMFPSGWKRDVPVQHIYCVSLWSLGGCWDIRIMVVH